MVETIRVDTLDGVKNLVFEQERNQDNGRFRSSFFYRGFLMIAKNYQRA